MQYDGSNGEMIAAAMTEAKNVGVADGDRKTIIVNPDHTGPALSLSQRWPNGQTIGDRWRVPVGYWINPHSGECRDRAGTPQDWGALTADE